MKTKVVLSAILILGVLTAFIAQDGAKKGAKPTPKPKDTYVLIETDSGNIKVRLYNETPQHRDNFIKLVNQKFYDSLLFHRIIKEFMIQGGDPQSKNAPAGQMLGMGDVGYTIPAEFHDSLFHKKGALAAARNDNPQKASSGCQFYIVQGKVFKPEELDMMENNMNMMAKQEIFNQLMSKPEYAELRNKFILFQQTNNIDSLQALGRQVEPLIEEEFKKTKHFKFTDKQRAAYSTTGGTPHLDRNYTVFGEVVEGLEVIDKIASVPTSQPGDRPVKDIRMKMKIVKK